MDKSKFVFHVFISIIIHNLRDVGLVFLIYHYILIILKAVNLVELEVLMIVRVTIHFVHLHE